MSEGSLLAVRNLDRASVSRDVSMELVGHKTAEIYSRYNITSPQDKRDVGRKLDAATPPVATASTN